MHPVNLAEPSFQTPGRLLLPSNHVQLNNIDDAVEAAENDDDPAIV